MRQLLSLIWLRWRIFVNRWWLHNTVPNRIASLLLLGLLTFLSLIFGVVIFLAVVNLGTRKDGARFLWEFNQGFFFFIFLTWVMAGLLKRDSSGVGQLKGYLFLPLSCENLSNFSLFFQLITIPATFLYPLLLGHLLGTAYAGHMVLNSLRFWMCAFELILLIVVTAVTAEVLYNLVDQFLSRGAAAHLIVWAALLAFATSSALALYPTLSSSMTAYFSYDALRSITFPTQLLPPSLVSAELTRSVLRDAENVPHVLVLVGLFVFALACYRINALVSRRLYLTNAGHHSTARRQARGGQKCNWWQWPYLPPPIVAIAHKELTYVGRSSLGNMTIGLFFLLSLGNKPMTAGFDRDIRNLHLLSSSASTELSVFLALVMTTGILLFYVTNYFGFDGNGLMLFFTSPLRRRSLLLGKNLAWWVMVEACLAGSLFISYATGGFRPIGNVQMIIVAVQVYLFLSAIVGNFISIAFPQKLLVASLRWNSLSSSTPPLFILIGWAVSGLLGGLTLIAAEGHGLALKWVILMGAALASGSTYYLSLAWSERHLERNMDALLQAIAFTH
ncbi:MAG: hypothetical protein PHX83_08075 [Acidobacteriia bacterium]|nr:hypothetical protein [Terriglobia bacterium]